MAIGYLENYTTCEQTDYLPWKELQLDNKCASFRQVLTKEKVSVDRLYFLWDYSMYGSGTILPVAMRSCINYVFSGILH